MAFPGARSFAGPQWVDCASLLWETLVVPDHRVGLGEIVVEANTRKDNLSRASNG